MGLAGTIRASLPRGGQVARRQLLWLAVGLLVLVAVLWLLQLRTLHDAPSDPAGEAQRRARREQRRFCEERHPVSLPGASLLTLDVRISEDHAMPLRMYVYDTNDVVSNRIKSVGEWEPHVQAQIVKAMTRSSSPNPLFVDVGAHIGYHTMMLAAHGFRVLAIEGMQDNVDMLRSTLCENPLLLERVTLLATGVGKAPAECAVLAPDDNIGDGRVICTGADDSDASPPHAFASQTQQHRQQRKHKAHKQHGRSRTGGDHFAAAAGGAADALDTLPANYTQRGTMQLQRLDALVAEDVQILKMDVEGFEPLVLAGAEGLFAERRVAHIIGEFAPALLRKAQLDPLDALHQVGLLGFRCSRKGVSGPWLAGQALAKLAAHSEADASGAVWAINLFCKHQRVAAGPAVGRTHNLDLRD